GYLALETAGRHVAVLVQRKMESGLSLLVSIPLFGRDAKTAESIHFHFRRPNRCSSATTCRSQLPVKSVIGPQPVVPDYHANHWSRPMPLPSTIARIVPSGSTRPR